MDMAQPLAQHELDGMSREEWVAGIAVPAAKHYARFLPQRGGAHISHQSFITSLGVEDLLQGGTSLVEVSQHAKSGVAFRLGCVQAH
ncbi:hypothetical protein D3C80_2063320 [compost metagenome]